MPFPDAHPALAKALADKGYDEPTPVQTAVLAADRARDLLVSSRTGSGKTVAFGLAFAPLLLGEAEKFERPGEPLALIIAPTRELSMQVQRELAWLYAPTGARVVPCVGGMDIRREQRALRDGTHIVVGTPGRLCDHLDRGNLALGSLRVVVLDEADEMLDLGFKDDLEHILGATPATRRTLLFSATLPPETAALAKAVQKDPVRIAATDPREAHVDIEYRAVLVHPRERDHAVVNVLRRIEPPSALVFCNTREGVYHLHANLLERGFHAVAISGELTQAERTRALQALRDGHARVLVATDVAARGLDLPELSLVIHADLPHDAQVMQHRSGRTGRAGRKGIAVVLVPANKRHVAERLFHMARIEPLRMVPPSAEDILERDQLRLIDDLAAVTTEPAEEDLVVARKLLETRPPEELVAALVAIHRGRRPAPEDLVETAALHARIARPAPPPVERPLGEAVWFHVNVGRMHNANPRWLLPLLCRRGDVGKESLGRIEVRERDTKFEVALDMAAHFEHMSSAPDRKDPRVRIRPFKE
jgi:ATP-dependent RNA helicase DeaD